MTSKQNQRDTLTDNAYVQWKEKEEWSLTQAMYLLHGLVPLESTATNSDLKQEFPDAKEMLQNLPKSNQELFRESPENWALLAMADNVQVTDCWMAIFPQCIKDDFEFILGKIPDYRRFLQLFVSDTATRLGKLAEYVLNLGTNAMKNPPTQFNNILEDMNTALGLNTKEINRLPERMVSPRQFINKCPRHYFHSASQCIQWIEWPSKHPKLAALLKTSGNAKKTTKSKTAAGNPYEEAYQAIIRSYISDVENGLKKNNLPGLKNKIITLKDHYLHTINETIGNKWPEAETLRSQLSRKFGDPKAHEKVRTAKRRENRFNR